MAVLGAGRMGAAIAGLWAASGSDVCITTSHRTDPSEALGRVGCDAVRWAASAGEAAQGASFVIEALPEVLKLKQDQLISTTGFTASPLDDEHVVTSYSRHRPCTRTARAARRRPFLQSA